MRDKPYRHLLYLLIRLIGLIVYPLPLKIGTKIGSLIGKLVFYILPKEREKALSHLSIAFGREKNKKELRKIALTLFSNLGKNAIEWFNFSKIDSKWFEKHVRAEGIEHLEEARKKGKGMIVLISHFGNWELTGAYIAHRGFSGTTIARRIYIEKINRLIVNMRKQKKIDVIYRDESPKKILHILRNNGVIGILADQDVASVEGVFVDFFGKPAYTPTGPVKLAMKTGAAIIPTFLVRESGDFRLFVEKEIALDISGDKERDILINTVKWTRVLEKYIRKYPDHWVWMHRRWKTRPKEEAAASR